MLIGSIVIANDLLGIVIGQKDNMLLVVDKHDKEYTIKRSACKEINNPHALAALVYNKLRRLAPPCAE